MEQLHFSHYCLKYFLHTNIYALSVTDTFLAFQWGFSPELWKSTKLLDDFFQVLTVTPDQNGKVQLKYSRTL